VKPALIVNENFPLPALRKLREEGLGVIAACGSVNADSIRSTAKAPGFAG